VSYSGDGRPALLLIEDDREDALLVRALLEEAAEAGEDRGTGELVWAPTLDDAAAYLEAGPACVLLDLGLPGTAGAHAVERVVRAAPDSAVVVLTGLDDESGGLEAIARGAQDYLIKGTADGTLIARSIRYAIERKRASNTARRLREAELRTQENVRLERGLLPRPLLRSDTIQCMTLYRPGGEQALLGGDFFDVVELDDGTVRAMIGDVAGHGPDEAALGVRLRVAWRTLVLAGVPPEHTFETLQDLFASERPSMEVFVTVCDLCVSPERDVMRILLAGHPAPIIVNGGEAVTYEGRAGPPLGVMDSAVWPTNYVELKPTWATVLYTDGLVENVEVVTEDGSRGRLGADGLVDLVRLAIGQGHSIERIVQETLATLQTPRLPAMSDDVAIVALSSRGSRS
jgi:serine phosphatase RsbU (regulator of sigma subunit)